MSRTRRTPLRVGILATLLCAGLLSQVVAGSPSRLGRLFHEAPGAPGELEPAGAVVASGDVVRSVSRPALLRLENGHVLKLSANSAIVIEGLPSGSVHVTVLAGRVLMVGRGGRLHVAGAGGNFRRSPTALDARPAERLLLSLGASDEIARHEIDLD